MTSVVESSVSEPSGFHALTPRPQPGQAIGLYAKPSPMFEAKLAATELLLREAAALGRVVQANSLGAEDMVITHLINALQLPIGVFVLDTGALNDETVDLLRQLEKQQAAHPHAPLTVYRPVAAEVDAFVAQEGADAMYQSIALRKTCCDIRKLRPMAQALAGQRAWVTGLRREQSGARAEVPAIDTSEEATHQRLKFNPLVDWTWGDVWHYIATRGVPYNPLHDAFFPSIGCAPCTRAISVGEDFRAGRWWWEDDATKECGLHVKK